ncbi:MAG TPA: prenyltransferase/squalene oxidase repeat-containing protein [Methylomirabilota bacterium]|nr:prenyltransferase/squalene oxidase repeat-containing protein [Methylomirabilota bacterium]
MPLPSRIAASAAKAECELLAERTPEGIWVGELSTSALSTATAILALATMERVESTPPRPQLIARGLEWLANHQNPDGGWGDTVLSFSNISTTALGWAAFGSGPGADAQFAETVQRAEAWLKEAAGGDLRERLPQAIAERYGKDRTFSVPILMACVLGQRFETGAEGWKRVLPLPFELAALPSSFWGAIQLPVVSYALPALIAIGQGREFHAPTSNPVTGLARRAARKRTLKILESLQPPNGGFLEAVPLTSFVSMSLASMRLQDNPTLQRGLQFIEASVRPDGSWPIDTNLSTWVTTLAVNGLSPGIEKADAIIDWLLAQQTAGVHPYTNAAPGAWAWTPLPGGVPDADDTAGALLALSKLEARSPRAIHAAERGVKWLLDLQNRDGGIPTFCRGWGALPFDRSSPDITAHSLRAWAAWEPAMPAHLQKRVERARKRAIQFLQKTQNEDGSWSPLWFGNQHSPDESNRTYGTTRALLGLLSAGESSALAKGLEWLANKQNEDGSWGGGCAAMSSIEETALAVEALAAAGGQWLSAARRGGEWLAERVETGEWRHPAPIGFYFAKLWYFERLYPLIYTVGALNQLNAAR